VRVYFVTREMSISSPGSLFISLCLSQFFMSVYSISPPGSLFNLSTFDLQLPVAASGGGVEVIKSKDLVNGYSSQYFYTDPNDFSMVFYCPENGAHTSGSTFPRSELRQNPDFTLKAGGRHVLNVTIAVTETTAKKSITIGQAHIDGLSGHCSIFVELEWTNGDIVSHLRDKNCGSVSEIIGKGYALGDKVTYSIVVYGATTIVSTDRGSMKPYTYSWLPVSTPVYFKAGNYLQDSGSNGKLGGTIKIYNISTSHLN